MSEINNHEGFRGSLPKGYLGGGIMQNVAHRNASVICDASEKPVFGDYPLYFNEGVDVFVQVGERTIASHVIAPEDSEGPEDVVTVVKIAGNPSSRRGPHISKRAIAALGVQQVAIDRPGCGKTSRKPGLTVIDTAYDIEATMDELGVERFAVDARSAGTATGLACAALMPDRISNLILAGPVAPPLSTKGMETGNAEAFAEAANDHEALYASRRKIAAELHNDYFSLMRTLIPELRGGDKSIPNELLHAIARGHAEGVGDGSGWGDSMISFLKPWGVAFGRIVCLVSIWFCPDDPFTSTDDALWLAQNLSNVEVWSDADVSHLSLAVEEARHIEYARNVHLGPKRLRLKHVLRTPSFEEAETYLEKAASTALGDLGDILEDPARLRSYEALIHRMTGYSNKEKREAVRMLLTTSDETLAARYPKQWYDLSPI